MFLLLSLAAVVQPPLVRAAPSSAPVPVPRAPLQSYVSSDDYPAGLPRSAARPVGVTLVVGPDGRVTQCMIVASSGASLLDQATCRLLRSRSRFLPARDAAGVAISGEASATLDWTALELGGARALPAGDQRITLAPWESISRLRTRLGQVASCQWQNTGVVPSPPSSNACQNPQLARMALGMAAENRVLLDKEVVVTLRLIGADIKPSPATRDALIDLAAELNVGADGRLTGCRFLREEVRTTAPQRPDCQQIFVGPYIPATDEKGQAIATTHRAELRVETR